MKPKLWMIVWLVLGGYSIVAAHGGGGAISAAMAMVCGFMVARNVTDMTKPKSHT